MKKFLNQFAVFMVLIVLFAGIANAEWIQADEDWANIQAFTINDNVLFMVKNRLLYRSTDSGSNWTCIKFPKDINVNCLAGDHFVGTGRGVFYSADNFMTMIPVNTGLINMRISCLVKIFGYLFAGTPDGIFRSLVFNISATGINDLAWSPVNSGLTDEHITSFAVSNGNIFAGTAFGGVFLSTDNGDTWKAANSGFTNRQELNIGSLAAYGSNIFAGTCYGDGGVFLSSNNGKSWNDVGLTHYNIGHLFVIGSNIIAQAQNNSETIFSSGVWRRPLSEMIVIQTNVKK